MKKKRFEEIGKRLRNVRTSLRLSQTEMAEALDISSCYLSHIETGIGNPGIEFFTKLCKEYSISLDYLFTGVGSMFIEKKARVEREFVGNISDLSDFLWLMENSPIFFNFIMAQGGKYFYDNEDILRENAKRSRAARKNKTV